LDSAKDSVLEDDYCRSVSLLQAISDLFDFNATSMFLPKGIAKIERVTIEAIRIEFHDKIDEGLLSRIAKEEGFATEKGSFPLRVVKNGTIIVRVGSESDIGGGFDLYLYLFPAEMQKISLYTKLVAEREDILDRSTGEINLGNLHKFNLKVVKMANRYTKERYC